ncbi:MAG: hypothetical protein HC778_00525 [Chamaesiphon sp. CSU_1_12]|nr:hypothetical protein [Chamaesiphon sp. CSU_1_12]
MGQWRMLKRFIVMPLVSARYIQATFATEKPSPKTVKVTKGKLSGRTYTVEFSSDINGTRYQLGYANGTKTVGTPAKKVQKIKWISFYVPRGVNLKEFLRAIFTKIKSKPILLKTPAGVTTRLQY